MELNIGDVVRIEGKRGTFKIAERIVNEHGDGYRVISDKTLQSHFYRTHEVKPKKAKRKRKR